MLTGITYSMELYITHTIQTFHIYLREGVNSPCNIHAHTAINSHRSIMAPFHAIVL